MKGSKKEKNETIKNCQKNNSCDVDNNNNETLVCLIKDGNEEAFRDLLKEFKNMIKKLISNYQSTVGDFAYDIDDIYQEACLTLYKACISYKDNLGMKFSSYAYLLLRSTVINKCKKNYKIRKGEYYSIDIYEHLDYDKRTATTYVSDNPIEYVKEKERNQKIMDFINSLCLEDQKIVVMRSKEFTYKQIAKALDISVKRVDNRLAYIKRKVRQLMKEEENSNK